MHAFDGFVDGKPNVVDPQAPRYRGPGRTAAAKPAPDIRAASRTGVHQPGAAICARNQDR
jgi:hypothetical protein